MPKVARRANKKREGSLLSFVLNCLNAFPGSTDGTGNPGIHEHICGNSIRQRIPESHTRRLVFDFLPVPRKNEEGYNQSDPQADKNGRPGSETPGSLILNHIDRNAIDPMQESTKKNPDEHLYFGAGIFLLG
jgi:hypothetical protein